jgi:hypothetical protein
MQSLISKTNNISHSRKAIVTVNVLEEYKDIITKRPPTSKSISKKSTTNYNPSLYKALGRPIKTGLSEHSYEKKRTALNNASVSAPRSLSTSTEFNLTPSKISPRLKMPTKWSPQRLKT